MANILFGMFNVIGSVAKGLFGVRTEQAKAINAALETVQDVNASEKDRAVAFAQYMAAEAQSGYWLSASIRPIIALLLVILVTCWFFGIAPPNLTEPMPPFIEKAVDALMVFIGFYVPGRSLEKIAKTVMTSKVLEKFLSKYV